MKPTRPADKEALELELERHKAEFAAKGGKITQLPPGHSKETPIEFAHSLGPLTVEQNRIKAGKDAQKFSINREARTLGKGKRPVEEV